MSAGKCIWNFLCYLYLTGGIWCILYFFQAEHPLIFSTFNIPMSILVAITTSKDAEGADSFELCRELERIIPHSHYIYFNEELPDCAVLVKVVENAGKPFYIRLAAPEGEVEFRIVSYKSKKYLRNRAVITSESPQLFVHDFTTPLGHQVVDWFARLFPSRIEGRQVASFHCKKDFIFFRLHRYIFREDHVDMQDIGPHLILRLKKLTSSTEVVYECNKYDKNVLVL